MKNIKIYGDAISANLYLITDFLKRSSIQFSWVSSLTNTNAIRFEDGTIIYNPTVNEVADKLGWVAEPKCTEYDVSIFGGGVAGLSAAVYAASEGLRTVIVERETIGGQAGTSSLIENYLGFPKGISGAELALRAREQALKFGVEILLLKEGIKGVSKDNNINIQLATGETITSKTTICATGVEYAKLNLANENKYLNKGLYYGAGASEAPFCKHKDVYVVGGGNSAGQAAVYFSKFAKRVYMVIRKGNLSETMSDYLVKHISTITNISILYNSEVTDLSGKKGLEAIKIFNSKTNQTDFFKTSKLFVCIGGKPNTDWAKDTAICRDRNGYLYTGNDLIELDQYKECWKHDRQPFHLETSVAGVFAAGDVRFNSVKRVASAVGEGAMAVTQIHQYLSKL